MAAAPYRNRFTPIVRTSPEIKKECHLSEPEAESSIRIADVRAIDMISVTPVRVRSSCTCRAPGHIGDAAVFGVTPSPTVLVAAGRLDHDTRHFGPPAAEPDRQWGPTAWRNGRRRGDTKERSGSYLSPECRSDADRCRGYRARSWRV